MKAAIGDVYKRQSHGRGHAAPSCRLYPGSNGADEGTVNESVYEAGAQAEDGIRDLSL